MPFEHPENRARAVLNMLLYATATAVLTLALATALSGANRELAERVDRNAEVTRSGVDTVMCVLLTDPGFRDSGTIQRCAAEHGYEYSPGG